MSCVSSYLEAYDLRDPEQPVGGSRGWKKIATVQRYDKPAVFPGPKFAIGWIRGHMHCLYNFLHAVAQNQPAEPSLSRGVQLQRMLAVAQRSAETGTWQSMPR